MTLTQKFNLRNLPCFSFFNIFNELFAFRLSFLHPIATSCEVLSNGYFQSLLKNFLISFAFQFIGVKPLSFQRGAKLRSFFNLPKDFSNFFRFLLSHPLLRTLPFLAAAKVIKLFNSPKNIWSFLNFLYSLSTSQCLLWTLTLLQNISAFPF